MGEVIRFPDELGPRGGRYVDANTEPATVIILPVIRIDRGPDGSNGLEPDTGNNTGAPAFDQRGTPFARIVNGTIDIGAFESPVLAAVLPCKLDMNGDNQLSALSEGLILLRAMFGMTGTAILNGTGITQGQWDAVRNNLNANCGTNFAP